MWYIGLYDPEYEAPAVDRAHVDAVGAGITLQRVSYAAKPIWVNSQRSQHFYELSRPQPHNIVRS